MTEKEMRTGWLWLALQMLLLPSLITQLAGGLGSAAVNFLYHLVSFAAVLVLFRGFLARSLRSFGRGIGKALPVIALALAAYYLSGWLVNRVILALDGEFFNVNDNSIRSLRQQGMVLTALATVVLAPVSEECLFRGLIFHTAGKYGTAAAYLVSAAGFAALHIAGYLGAAPALRLGLCFLQYLPVGLILAAAMERTGSIVTAMCIHFIINAVSMAEIL